MKEKKEVVLPQIEGYEPVLKKIGIIAANIWAVAFTIFFMVVGWALILYVFFPSISFGIEDSMYLAKECLWFSLLMFLGIVVHELVHGITFLLVLRKGYSHLSFGINMCCAYCHIDVPMKKRNYIIGAMMPLLLIGIVPWLVGTAVGSLLWMNLGAVMIGGAVGDMMILWSLRKEPADTMVYDHPTMPGYYVYRKIPQS